MRTPYSVKTKGRYFLYEPDRGWFGSPYKDERTRTNKTRAELWENVLEERIMMALELSDVITGL